MVFAPKTAGPTGAPVQFTDTLGDTYIEPLAGIGNAPVASLLPGLTSALAGTGGAGYTGDGAAATAAQLQGPRSIAVDALGNIFFADTSNNVVREIATSGTIDTVAGGGTGTCSGSTNFIGDGCMPRQATLNAPAGLAIDGAGSLYIADTGNNRVRRVANGVITTFAGTGTAGYLGDGGLPTSAQLKAPQGLFLTPAGALYIADTGNNVVRLVGVTQVVGLSGPGTTISTVAGTGVAGFSGDGSNAQFAQLSRPSAVAVDTLGNVYIADSGNNRIRVLSSVVASSTTSAGPCVLGTGVGTSFVCSNVISTFAGSGSTGSVNGAANLASFNNPTALAVDAAGDIYVAGTGSNAIRLLSAGQVSTIAGTGAAGSTGNGGASNLAAFSAPAGIALDHSGNILVADTGNNTLRSISSSSSGIAFPTISPGNTASSTVSLVNSGNLPLAISSIMFPIGFSEQPSGGTDCNTASLTLAPSAACLANIVFSPTAVQSYSGNVTITDKSQSAANATQAVAVSGVGAYTFTASISTATTVVAGTSQSITVSVKNPQANYTGTIQFTSSDARAVLPAPYTFTAADNSTHVFTVTLKTAGAQTITIADTANASITASATTLVSGGPAASLIVLSGNNQTDTINVNANYSLPLTVEALDNLGNPSPGASVTLTAPASGATVTFNGSNTFTGTTNALGQLSTPVP